ncbi:sigma-70 family RNA polymerase sigma factor [Stakelama pacifica]|uniref:sigma-70 family RNA polymerase sigma factor n=1 Tax=Stakelama pacifica TaxID=517720 RepID=UPI003570EBE9
MFETHRPRLKSLAYRMTGSLTDSEDIVQEAWVRWSRSDHAAVNDTARWLTTITARQCLDHLHSARVRRERYVGAWLPDPLITERAPDAEGFLSEAQDVRIALLLTLQMLAPPMRAAFLLREAFDFTYAEIADVTGGTDAAARQLVSRAQANGRRRARSIGQYRGRRETCPRFLGSQSNRRHGGFACAVYGRH